LCVGKNENLRFLREALLRAFCFPQPIFKKIKFYNKLTIKTPPSKLTNKLSTLVSREMAELSEAKLRVKN
jgi:hypothetical protein